MENLISDKVFWVSVWCLASIGEFVFICLMYQLFELLTAVDTIVEVHNDEG